MLCTVSVFSFYSYCNVTHHRNLDDRTRNVYRENVRMAEALSLHMEHEESLQKSKGQLEMANRQLVAEKELNQQLVQDKIRQARQHKKLIKDLQVRPMK